MGVVANVEAHASMLRREEVEVDAAPDVEAMDKISRRPGPRVLQKDVLPEEICVTACHKRRGVTLDLFGKEVVGRIS